MADQTNNRYSIGFRLSHGIYTPGKDIEKSLLEAADHIVVSKRLPHEAEETKQLLRDIQPSLSGSAVPLLHVSDNLIYDDPTDRDGFVQRLEECHALSRELAAPNYISFHYAPPYFSNQYSFVFVDRERHPGKVRIELEPDVDPLNREEFAKHFKQTLDDALGIDSELKASLEIMDPPLRLLQQHPQLRDFYHPDTILNFVRDLDNERVGILLDYGHLGLVQHHLELSDEDITQIITGLSPHVFGVHLSQPNLAAEPDLMDSHDRFRRIREFKTHARNMPNLTYITLEYNGSVSIEEIIEDIQSLRSSRYA